MTLLPWQRGFDWRTTKVSTPYSTQSGNHSNHRQGQYHLEVKDAALRWFHRNEFGDTVFNVKSGTLCLLVMICHNTDFQLSGSGNGLDLKSEGTLFVLCWLCSAEELCGHVISCCPQESVKINNMIIAMQRTKCTSARKW